MINCQRTLLAKFEAESERIRKAPVEYPRYSSCSSLSEDGSGIESKCEEVVQKEDNNEKDVESQSKEEKQRGEEEDGLESEESEAESPNVVADLYRMDQKPFCQGAEARLFACVFLHRPAVLKERFMKRYRHPELDARLGKERMRAELKAILKCHEVINYLFMDKSSAKRFNLPINLILNLPTLNDYF